MKSALLIPILLSFAAAKPGVQAASRGAVVARETMPTYVIAEGKAGARLLLDGTTAPGFREASMSELVMLPGAAVPEHVHDTSAELLYVLEGSGEMTLDGKRIEVKRGMAIYIPRGVKHSFRMTSSIESLRALQIYTPGGPEQRFKKGKAVRD